MEKIPWSEDKKKKKKYVKEEKNIICKGLDI